MTPITKYCADCRHAVLANALPDETMKCGHPMLVSLVTGKPIWHCSTERAGDLKGSENVYPCGKVGRLFEEKSATTNY